MSENVEIKTWYFDDKPLPADTELIGISGEYETTRVVLTGRKVHVFRGEEGVAPFRFEGMVARVEGDTAYVYSDKALVGDGWGGSRGKRAG